MRFAILECSGYNKDSPPGESHVKDILEPFLLEKKWKVEYIAYIKDVATLVGIRSEIATEHPDLQKVLSDFKKFIEEKYSKLTVEELGEVQYPNLHLGRNIEIMVLLTSTEQDSNIFANQVVATQLKKIQLELEKTTEQVQSLAQKFRNL